MARALMALALFLGIALAVVPEDVRSAGAAVYNLWVMDNGRVAIICTGTIAQTADGPRFISAGHCVSDFPRARYYISRSADPDQLVRVHLVWWVFGGIEAWREGDYAIFRLPESFQPEAALPICKGLPEPGDSVWAWTGPLGMLPILRTGVYSGEIHFPDDQAIEEAIGGMPLVDIEGAPGSSGSAMLRLEGERVCMWGVWVGAFTHGPSGAIVSKLPKVLMDETP